MAAKAEDQAKAAAEPDGRTDREKLADIGLSEAEMAALEGKDTDEAADKGGSGKDADKPKDQEADDATKRKDAAEAGDKEDADCRRYSGRRYRTR